MILPIITSIGRVGMERRFSMVPLSRSRVIARRGDHDHGHREDDAHQAGHDIVLRDRFGVVERVDPQVDGTVAPGPERRAGL